MPVHLIDGATVVALTAGASAPPAVVDRGVAELRKYGSVLVEEREIARETCTSHRRPGPAPTVGLRGRKTRAVRASALVRDVSTIERSWLVVHRKLVTRIPGCDT